jgi:hypothetical protein
LTMLLAISILAAAAAYGISRASGLDSYPNQQILYSMVHSAAINAGIVNKALPQDIRDSELTVRMPYSVGLDNLISYDLNGDKAVLDSMAGEVYMGRTPDPNFRQLTAPLVDASRLFDMEEVTHLGKGVDDPTTETVKHYRWYSAQYVGSDFDNQVAFIRNLDLQLLFNHLGVATLIFYNETGSYPSNVGELETFWGYERNAQFWQQVNVVGSPEEVDGSVGNVYLGGSSYGNWVLSVNIGSQVLSHEFGQRSDGSTGSSIGFMY